MEKKWNTLSRAHERKQDKTTRHPMSHLTSFIMVGLFMSVMVWPFSGLLLSPFCQYETYFFCLEVVKMWNTLSPAHKRKLLDDSTDLEGGVE